MSAPHAAGTSPMPGAGVHVRAAVGADLERVTEIYAHHVRHGTATFEIEPPSRAEIERRFEEVAGRELPWLVAASAGGEIVGYGYANIFRARPAYRFTVEDSVYLDPAWTRRGIGRALIAHLIDDAERRGCRQMLAVIGDSANAGSIGVHRALGFRDVGVFRDVGFKFGRWLDVVLMQRALGTGGETLPAAGSGLETGSV